MTDKTTIRIVVEGPLHAGKTSIIALLTNMLTENGVECVVQRADPQLSEKLEDKEEAVLRARNCRVILTEMQTAR